MSTAENDAEQPEVKPDRKGLIAKIASWGIGIAIWTASIGTGFLILYYLGQETPVEEEATALPPEIKSIVNRLEMQHLDELVPKKRGTKNVVMAINPYCPCTSKSLAELERIKSIYPNGSGYFFLIGVPANKNIASESPLTTSWTNTRNTRIAAGLVGAKLIKDVDSKKADKLGLFSSGAVAVIDSNGAVIFRGGITSGWTKSEENPGRKALSTLISGGEGDLEEFPVYGCRMPIAGAD